MKQLFTHNIGWKLVSLLAAFLVWWSIGNDTDLATILSAPVQFREYPKNLEISSAIVESIDIDARGPAGQLRDLRTARLSAIVDFSSVKEAGERTFTLTSKEVRLPRGVELVRTIPAQLRFTFENRTSRQLKVDVPLVGTVPDGLVVSKIEVFPPALPVTGPESRVSAARNALADPVDLSRVHADTQQQVAVYVVEPQVRFVVKPQVTVKIHVEHRH